jgi:hypothetical protein
MLPCRAAVAQGLLELLSEPPTGWELKAPGARSYGPADLFEYIDGNAELFLAYGFKQLAVGDYLRPGAAEGTEAEWISVDIYDMGAPLHAFGIFRSERAPGAKVFPAGVEGYQGDGLVALWAGPYYVKVALVEGDDTETARALAAAAAAKLPLARQMPSELKRLPTRDRIAGTEQYARKNALGYGFLGEMLSAEYRLGNATATLYVCDLGSETKAGQAATKLKAAEVKGGAKLTKPAVARKDAFSARGSSLGEMVASRAGRFLVIAGSEKAKPPALAALVRAAMKGLR